MYNKVEQTEMEQLKRLVLVTGPSGAGRSTTIGALEDLGYETIDNLPLSLVARVADPSTSNRPLAVGIDTRNRDFSTHGVIDLLQTLATIEGLKCELLYIHCEADVLMRRFSETRRRHPLAPAETPLQGIELEFDLLAPIKARADVLIDSSELSPHQLKSEIRHWFANFSGNDLAVSVQSFSYKRGLPRGIDMMFDCRFLNNPYWDESLRALNGKDAGVQSYVKNDPRFAVFFEKVREMCIFLLPAYAEEGKTHFSIGFGCTGGQHRSVTLAETMALSLAENGWQVSIRHRELERT